jgi:hypothetical protein
MTNPEEALEQARALAAKARAEGGYAQDLEGFEIEAGAVSREQLLQWALIEPDPDLVYSTRRLGAPVTFVKRALLRALRQYHVELNAQQTRFNIQLLGYIRELEERVAVLESRAGRGGGGRAVESSVLGPGDAASAQERKSVPGPDTESSPPLSPPPS